LDDSSVSHGPILGVILGLKYLKTKLRKNQLNELKIKIPFTFYK